MAGRVRRFFIQPKGCGSVYKYIQHQEEHHKIQTFTEEYLELLIEFKVEYDKQYIFQEMI